MRMNIVSTQNFKHEQTPPLRFAQAPERGKILTLKVFSLTMSYVVVCLL